VAVADVVGEEEDEAVSDTDAVMEGEGDCEKLYMERSERNDFN
jgi:hypothetical protein